MIRNVRQRIARGLLMLTALATNPTALDAQRDSGNLLTLDRALALAERNDAGIALAALAVEEHRHRVRWSLGSFLPSASVTLGTSAFAATTVTGEDDFGRPRELGTPLHYRGTSSYQSLNVSWTLFDGGRRWSDRDGARALLKLSTARLRIEQLRARADATRRYYATVQSRMQLDSEHRTLDLLVQHLGISERLFRLASIDHSDLLGAQAQVAMQRRRVRIARLEMQRADAALATLVGAGVWGLGVDTTLVDAVDPGSIKWRVDSAIAAMTHPSLSAADAELASTEHRARGAGASRWPQIALGASLSRSISLSSEAALGVIDPRNNSRSLGVSLSLPVFSQFQRMVAMDEAQLEARRGRIAWDARRAAVRSEIADAWVTLCVAWERAGAAVEVAEQERTRAGMTRRRYESGAISFAMLQDVAERAIAADREVHESRMAYVLALAALEQRAGTPLRH